MNDSEAVETEQCSCPKCKKEVAASVDECPHCGAVLKGSWIKCPTCNGRIDKDVATCPHCGKRFKGSWGFTILLFFVAEFILSVCVLAITLGASEFFHLSPWKGTPYPYVNLAYAFVGFAEPPLFLSTGGIITFIMSIGFAYRYRKGEQIGAILKSVAGNGLVLGAMLAWSAVSLTNVSEHIFGVLVPPALIWICIQLAFDKANQ